MSYFYCWYYTCSRTLYTSLFKTLKKQDNYENSKCKPGKKLW